MGFRTLAAFLILVTLAGCGSGAQFFIKQEKRYMSLSPDTEAKGCAIIVHGLNTLPSAMDTIAAIMRNEGWAVNRLTLRGFEKGESDKDTSAALWTEDILSAYAACKTEHPGKPVIALGYSLGGALITRILDTQDDLKLDKLILLAPALRIPAYTAILRPFMFLRFFGASLPSRAPELFRAHSSTSFSSYHATFSTIDHIQSLSRPEKFKKLRTLLIVSTTDGVVCTSGILRWVKEHDLSEWKIVEIAPQAKIEGERGHAILDSIGAGDAGWAQIAQSIKDFMKN